MKALPGQLKRIQIIPKYIAAIVKHMQTFSFHNENQLSGTKAFDYDCKRNTHSIGPLMLSIFSVSLFIYCYPYLLFNLPNIYLVCLVFLAGFTHFLLSFKI